MHEENFAKLIFQTVYQNVQLLIYPLTPILGQSILDHGLRATMTNLRSKQGFILFPKIHAQAIFHFVQYFEKGNIR